MKRINPTEIRKSAAECVAVADGMREATRGHQIHMISATVALNAIEDYEKHRTMTGEYVPREELGEWDEKIKRAKQYFESRFEEAI